jgi:hypothetical protein
MIDFSCSGDNLLMSGTGVLNGDAPVETPLALIGLAAEKNEPGADGGGVVGVGEPIGAFPG